MSQGYVPDLPFPPDQDRPPVGQLDPVPWLHAPETVAVMDALTAEGHAARFVGGCVRDTLVHRPAAVRGWPDIDIATAAPPDTVVRLLEAAGLKAVPTGIAHGTVTGVARGRPFEITTLRRDTDCDGRHATVAFSDSFLEDARRRDFTFNALSADRDGRVYDYFEGIPDLTAGRVRFVGRARDRITEDYLRILRFFRFQAHYGLPPADRDAMEACASLAEGVDGLSRERVRKELLRLLEAPDPAGALSLMRGARVLSRLLPGAEDFARLRVLVLLETRGVALPGLGPDALRRLAAALGGADHTLGDAAGPQLGERLRLSKAETRRLTDMLDAPAAVLPRPGMALRDLRDQLDRAGRQVVVDRLLLAWAGERSQALRIDSARTDAWRDLLAVALDWQAPRLPVGGKDVQALGVPGGPLVGAVLARVRSWWLDAGCPADRPAALAELRRAVEAAQTGTPASSV